MEIQVLNLADIHIVHKIRIVVFVYNHIVILFCYISGVLLLWMMQ